MCFYEFTALLTARNIPIGIVRMVFIEHLIILCHIQGDKMYL